jgi:hypothetical protein
MPHIRTVEQHLLHTRLALRNKNSFQQVAVQRTKRKPPHQYIYEETIPTRVNIGIYWCGGKMETAVKLLPMTFRLF